MAEPAEIAIRTATRDDVEALRALIDVSARGLSAGYYTPEQIEAAVAEVFGVDTQLVDDGTYYVAEAGDRSGVLVGCGGWSRRQTLFGGDRWKGDREDAALDPARDPARIRAFFVHPEWARRGIGGRILRACETAAAAEGFRRLELMATLPGEPLYAAMGYQAIEPVGISMSGALELPCVRMGKDLE
jgi:GNAT superfamily N-acetyltransferase